MTVVAAQPKTIGEQIAEIAESYIGQTEIPGNKGFTNPAFQKKMESVGFKMTHAWCMYFCELVWKEAYGSDHSLFATLDKLFSASALSTYYNFSGNQGWKVDRTPSKGAIMIFKHGLDPRRWEGHGCIVIDPATALRKVTTVDGNTNDVGGREGYIVAKKLRQYGGGATAKGLNLLGFVHPI